MAKPLDIRKRLAENIALLEAIEQLPGRPQECVLPAEDESRQLTVERESQLADDFAFLAATTDDKNKIMGVGIEEHIDRQGMIVRIASNTGDLSKVRRDLEQICKILENASDPGRLRP